MNNNEFATIGLYDHNADSYKKIKSAFEMGEDVVGIVHATGTGKSYNALQLAYDNKDKKVVYVVPANGIIEHIKKIIDDNPNLDLKRDFPNLEFRTYQSFISLDREEIKNIKCDLLILDEFHHIGAPIWGARINTMVETHPKMKIFGMTAYTIRDRGTIYERDMANPDTDELFSGKIESRYSLCDAMIDGVLPKPVYKSAYTNLMSVESKLEEKVKRLVSSTKEYQEYMSILFDVKRRIHEAPSIPSILRENIKPNGKYIYFCPPCTEEGANDIETIKKQAFLWFKQFVPEEDIVIYTSTSRMGEAGKKNRDAFYDDVTISGEKVGNKLRVMFAINQYNEGIHAPNIDGVIMGRGTTSDIVYFEQLGRALAIRGNTKDMFDKLEKYSIPELMEMCKAKGIHVKEEMSKEELIEKLIAPVVIDLTNNYDFIKELENNLRSKIKEVSNRASVNHRDIKIKEASFDIEIEDQDLFEMLKYVSDRLMKTWEDYYELAKAYYEYHGNLNIPYHFKTNDGYTYDENGVVDLGRWMSRQRRQFSSLSKEKQHLLQSIDFIRDLLEEKWYKNYELAKAYYNHYGNSDIHYHFKTNNGYTYDEEGKVRLGAWLGYQRKKFFELSQEQQQLLQSIDFMLDPIEEKWHKNYEYAKAYYEHYGNLDVPHFFITNDGYTYDEKGKIRLGGWISTQRQSFSNLSKERRELLQAIGFILNASTEKWNRSYRCAKAYYEHYGNLNIPYHFKTNDGYTYDENGVVDLYTWVAFHRTNFSKLSKERKELLKSIGLILNPLEEKWMRNYNAAKKYYEYYGNLKIPYNFVTNDGYTYDEKGKINLWSWLSHQRRQFSSLSEEKQGLLQSIGLTLNDAENRWNRNYELAKAYYLKHHHLYMSPKYVTEDGIKLGSWIVSQRRYTSPDSEKGQLLSSIGMIWGIKQNRSKVIDICELYNIDQAKNKAILEHISIQELQSKIDFLKEHNIPILNDDLLLDIFSMSSPDMEEKYGISLTELISKYSKKSQKE